MEKPVLYRSIVARLLFHTRNSCATDEATAHFLYCFRKQLQDYFDSLMDTSRRRHRKIRSSRCVYIYTYIYASPPNNSFPRLIRLYHTGRGNSFLGGGRFLLIANATAGAHARQLI